MSKKSKIIEICFWIGSILNLVNLILIFPYQILTLTKLPFIFYIYFDIISIITIIFFILMIKNTIIGVD